MKQSEFNYVVSLDNGQYGIFNTYKNSLAILTEENMDHLKHLENATEEELNNFKELNFVVEDDVDERKITEEDTLKYANNDRVMLRVLTTLDCNADCTYCYENRNHVKMTRDTADKVVDFLKKITTDHLHIEWFGGEPLYNKEIISYICSKLYESDVDFSSSMVTNGILATEDVVNEFEYWKIKRVQITVDGVMHKYDKVKRVPDGTFYTVIDNIKNIIDHKIDVSIRLNYFRDNVETLKEVIDYMEKNIGYNEYLHYYSYPIFELCNEKAEFDADVVDKIYEIQDYIIAKGLDTSKHLYNIKYKGMGCFATHKNGYTIGPDGTLHGCSHTTYQSIGDVVNGDNENHKLFLANIPERCKDCVIYPICKGGCKVADLGYERINQCLVYKNRFDEFVKRMISNRLNDLK